MIFGHVEVLRKGAKLTLDQILDCSDLVWDELEFVFESFEFCELEELSHILGITIEELGPIYPKIRSWNDLIFKYGFLIKESNSSLFTSKTETKKRKLGEIPHG